jgi:glycosyltransferase involved in cell wall biosynthesis
VLSLHDVGHRDVFPHGRHDVVRAWRAMTYDRPARHATVVLTGSEHARERIAEVLGIPIEQIMVAYHGVDERFTPTPSDRDATLRERFGLPERFVYYPASIHPHKNHIRLLEALALMEDSELGLVLTGAATPPRLREVLDHAQALGLSQRVHHLGFVDDDDLPALYRTARAMAFPSMYEGFGLPPIEAMACGCPVASTHSGSLGEVCGDAAAVLEPEDVEQMAATITTAATDGPARDSLRERGFARAAMFTWYEAASKTLDAYRRAVALGG